MTLELKSGDPWPFRSARGLTGTQLDHPATYALITAPQGEGRAKSLLEAGRSVSVQFPTRTRVRHVCGKRRETSHPIIPRIIYATFRCAPQWDVLRARRVIVGVFCHHGRPVKLSPDDVARVMGLPTEAERQETAAREAARPRIGEMAKITMGPLSGFFVEVREVSGGEVLFEMSSGIRGRADVNALRRVNQAS